MRDVAVRAANRARASPATLGWLVVLVATTVYLTAHHKHAAAILQQNSTNLYQLTRRPLEVIASSPLWLESHVELVVWLVLFPTVLAPLERWLGTARWLVTAAAGHVGATLVTAAGISAYVHFGGPEYLDNLTDVGASYGVCALAAVACRAAPYWLPRRIRVPAWSGNAFFWALVITFAGIVVTDVQELSSWGHFIALLVGGACWPLWRTRVRRRPTSTA